MVLRYETDPPVPDEPDVYLPAVRGNNNKGPMIQIVNCKQDPDNPRPFLWGL